MATISSQFSLSLPLGRDGSTVGRRLQALKQRLSDQEKEARRLLCFGRNYLRFGRVDQARLYLDQLKKAYPESDEFASLAKDIARVQRAGKTDNASAVVH